MAIGSWAVARGRLVIRAGRCRCGSCRCGSVSYEFPYWFKAARLGHCARRPDGRRARPGLAATPWGTRGRIAAARPPLAPGTARGGCKPCQYREPSSAHRPWPPCRTPLPHGASEPTYDAGPPSASVEESSASRITSRNSRLIEFETIDAWTSPIICCDNGGRQAGKSLQRAPQVVRSGSFSPRWTQHFKLVVGSFLEADRSSLPALSW